MQLPNLLTANAASMETSVADWGGISATPTQSATYSHHGTKSCLVTWGTAAAGAAAMLATVSGLTVGRQYQVLLWVRVPAGQPRVHAVAAAASGSPSALNNEWQQLDVRFRATAVDHLLGIRNTDASTSGQTCYLDDVDVREYALTAALTSPSRRPSATVTVEWGGAAEYDTMTSKVSGLRIDRAISTDLPPAANMVTGGASAAQAVITVSGRDSTGRLISEALSPFTGVLPQRLGAKVTVRLGAMTEDGFYDLPAFVGHVRTMHISTGGVAEITALDGPESLTTAVTLPVFAANDPATGLAPGLNAQWVMDYILRRNGYYNDPAQRSSICLSATLHGSGWAELAYNTLTAYKGAAGSPQGPLPFAVGADGSLGVGGAPFVVGWTPINPPTTNTGQTLFIQIASLRASSAASLHLLTMNNGVSWSVSVDTNSSSRVTVTVVRNGASSGAVQVGTATLAGSYAANYVAVSITFTSGGFTAYSCVNGAVSTQATGTVGNPSGSPLLSYVEISTTSSTVHWGGLQVTTEAYTAGMWDDDFVPAAVLDASYNELIAMPPVLEAEPWTTLVKIAEAEQGVILFDESGIVRFYNRDRMATEDDSVVTIASTRALKSLSAEEQIDTVRNVVSVQALPPVIDAANAFVWQASEVLRVPASSNITIPVSFDGALISVDVPFDYLSGGTDVSAGSGYRAARNSDGTGGDVSNLSVSYDWYPGSARLVVINPNAYDVYLVENGLASTTRGQPMLHIVGRLSRQPENPYQATSADTVSRAQYGDQPLEVNGNLWRQASASTLALADDLLSKMKEPHPVLSDISVVGDPRLQLTDRVTLYTKDDLGGVLRDYWLIGKTTSLSLGEGLAETYTLREAGAAEAPPPELIWILEPNVGMGDPADAGELDWIYGLA